MRKYGMENEPSQATWTMGTRVCWSVRSREQRLERATHVAGTLGNIRLPVRSALPGGTKNELKMFGTALIHVMSRWHAFCDRVRFCGSLNSEG